MPLAVSMLTTVGDRCGIAAYTRALTAALEQLPDVQVEVEPIEPGKLDIEEYRRQAERLNRADVVHIQHEHSFWGGILPGHSAFWNLRYLIQKPVVITAHTTTSLRELLRIPTERRLAYRIAKELLVRRRGYRDEVEIAPFITGRTIVHTRSGAEELVARGANPKYLHVIPAGVPEALPAPTNGRAFRERLRLGDRPVVSLFGYLAPNKGYEVALAALDQLPAGAALVFAGGARTAEMVPYADGLRAEIERRGAGDRVLITGYLPDDELGDAMAASDVVAAPHTYATGSYSVMIPLAYGKAIVASDLPCFREIQESVPCLALTPAGESRPLGAAVSRLLCDPDARRRLEGLARAYAKTHSWREAARKTVRVYQEALADASRLAHHPVAR